MAPNSKKAKKPSMKETMKFELQGLILLVIAIITLFGKETEEPSTTNWGFLGAEFSKVCQFLIGNYDFIIPLLLGWLGLYIMVKRKWPNEWSHRKTGIVLLMMSFLAFMHILLFSDLNLDGRFDQPIWATSYDLVIQEVSKAEHGPPGQIGGGMIGAICLIVLYYLFGITGAKFMVLVLSLIAIMMITGLSFVNVGKKAKDIILYGIGELKQFLKEAILLVYDHKEQKNKTM
ncbi:MAG: DNA translocase FtsK 4TM domain-containing protein, partial [Bacilli bacterium]